MFGSTGGVRSKRGVKGVEKTGRAQDAVSGVGVLKRQTEG